MKKTALKFAFQVYNLQRYITGAAAFDWCRCRTRRWCTTSRTTAGLSVFSDFTLNISQTNVSINTTGVNVSSWWYSFDSIIYTTKRDPIPEGTNQIARYMQLTHSLKARRFSKFGGFSNGVELVAATLSRHLAPHVHLAEPAAVVRRRALPRPPRWGAAG